MDYIDKRLIASSVVFLAMLLAILWYGKESVAPKEELTPLPVLPEVEVITPEIPTLEGIDTGVYTELPEILPPLIEEELPPLQG